MQCRCPHLCDEPRAPPELQSHESVPEETEQLDSGGADAENLGPRWAFEEKNALFVNDLEVKKNSSMKMLRDAAEYLGISKGGSRAMLWSRLSQKVQTLEHQRLLATANKLYREEGYHKGLIPVPVARQPSSNMSCFTYRTETGANFALPVRAKVTPKEN